MHTELIYSLLRIGLFLIVLLVVLVYLIRQLRPRLIRDDTIHLPLPDSRLTRILSLITAWLILPTGGKPAVSDLNPATADPLPPSTLSSPSEREIQGSLPGIQLWRLGLLTLSLCLVSLATVLAGDQPFSPHAMLATGMWLIAIGLAVSGGSQGGEWRHVRISPVEMALTAALLAVAFLLRASGLEQMPTTLSGDEGGAGLAAVRFLNGELNNPFSLGWFSFPALHFMLQSAGIVLWGQTAGALRLTSALAGALTVVALYWLGRSMFDRLTGALAAGYLAASHYHIHMSRIGLNNVWDGLFGTLAIWGLWDGWKSGRRISFILCGLALGLGQYFYVTIRSLPILFLLWGILAFWRDRATFRKRLPGLLLAAFLSLIVFFPLGALFARHPDEFNAPFNRVAIMNDWLIQQLIAGEQTAVEMVMHNMLRGALGFTHQPLLLLYDSGVPLLLPGAAVLFLLGLLWALARFDLRYLLLLLPLLMVILFSAFGRESPASQRYILAVPVGALFVGLPLGLMVSWLRRLWPRWQLAELVAVALLGGVAMLDINYYFFHVYDHYLLGGLNTETATRVAYYLRNQEIEEQEVYFFGFPRMGYASFSTLPYLVPHIKGEDIPESPASLPVRQLRGPTIFIFLPERLAELQEVKTSFPGGFYREFSSRQGYLLFAVYEVRP